MKDREKIDEMAKTIGKARNYGCMDNDVCKDCCNRACIPYEIAVILYAEGYRKMEQSGEGNAKEVEYRVIVAPENVVS